MDKHRGFPLAKPVTTSTDLLMRLRCSVEFLLSLIPFNVLNDHVIVSGSLIEGLGNFLSDIDVFVISPELPQKKIDIWYWYNAQRWVDINWLPVSEVERIFKAVHRNGGAATQEWTDYECVSDDDLDLYHRLVIGLEVASPLYPSINLQKFDAQVLGREIVLTKIIPCRARWLDAVGAYHSKQYSQALYDARIAFDIAIDAYAALMGETNPGDKWRWAKINRIQNDPLNLASQFGKGFTGTRKSDAEQMIIKVAELLFQVMHYFLYGTLVWYEHDLPPDERYEIHRGTIIRVNAQGHGERTDRTFRVQDSPISVE